MFFWPITLWVALALWQTGSGRPQLGSSNGAAGGFPKKIILPASAVGSIATLIAIGATAPPAPALASAEHGISDVDYSVDANTGCCPIGDHSHRDDEPDYTAANDSESNSSARCNDKSDSRASAKGSASASAEASAEASARTTPGLQH